MRIITLAILLLCPAFGQSPAFEAADVRAVKVNPSNFNVFIKGPTVRAGRYEIRTATMVDLISKAYGVDQDKVLGGPTWVEMDRFDVVAKLPAESTRDSEKLMLQALLADRFKLAIHHDVKPMPAYMLSATKHPQLKESDGTGEKGCKFEFQGMPRGPQATPSEGPAPVPTVVYNCKNMTMEAFAEDMRRGIVQNFIKDKPILDKTALKGPWDFSFKFTFRGFMGATNAADNVTVFDALEKQLGLKMELTQTPLPVIAIDSVNQKPTDNVPDIEKLLPGSTAPTEFEVADIKPTPSDFLGARFQILVQQAWGISQEMIVGAPKWFGEDRFDIVAKAPSAALTGSGPNGPNIDFDAVMTMIKNLLAERFLLKSHLEERPMSAYTLLAAKPKMKPADPTGHTKCEEGPGADGKDPRDTNPVLGRLITCYNMSMAKFAELLQGLAPGYIHAPVLDSTGLEGTFDFTLSFSPAGALQNGGGRRGSDGPPQTQASDPNGALSLLDALPKELGLKLDMQKRPVEVMVIDHVEQKPTDN
jgi:uncharacterized protein (TIGR03435 family)